MGNTNSTNQTPVAPAPPQRPSMMDTLTAMSPIITQNLYIPPPADIPPNAVRKVATGQVCFEAPLSNPIFVQFRSVTQPPPVCQWLNPQSQAWQNWPMFSTQEECERNNECSQGGGCYQWVSPAPIETLTSDINPINLSHDPNSRLCVSPNNENRSVFIQFKAPTIVPAPIQSSQTPQAPQPPQPASPMQVLSDEEKVYNNLADAFLRNDPQFVPTIKTYFPPQVADQVFSDATAYLSSNRTEAINIAKSIGFAQPGKTGDVSRDLARWVSMMARNFRRQQRRNMTTSIDRAAVRAVPPLAAFGGDVQASTTSQSIMKDHSFILALVLLSAAGGLAYYLYKLKQKKNQQ